MNMERNLLEKTNKNLKIIKNKRRDKQKKKKKKKGNSLITRNKRFVLLYDMLTMGVERNGNFFYFGQAIRSQGKSQGLIVKMPIPEFCGGSDEMRRGLECPSP